MSGPQPIINERYRTGWKMAFGRPEKKLQITGEKGPKQAVRHCQIRILGIV